MMTVLSNCPAVTKTVRQLDGALLIHHLSFQQKHHSRVKAKQEMLCCLKKNHRRMAMSNVHPNHLNHRVEDQTEIDPSVCPVTRIASMARRYLFRETGWPGSWMQETQWTLVKKCRRWRHWISIVFGRFLSENHDTIWLSKLSNKEVSQFHPPGRSSHCVHIVGNWPRVHKH